MTERTTLLQALRLKGRARSDVLAPAAGASDEEVEREIEALLEEGLVETTTTGYRLSEAGRAVLNEELAHERGVVDANAVTALYDEFCELNDDVKAVMTDWQLRGGALNDHADAAYDGAVLNRLYEVQQRADALLARVEQIVPRLGVYRRRLAGAASEIHGGDHRYMASPVVDSIHNVWFEFHEELILVSGRTRAAEAEAGRAV